MNAKRIAEGLCWLGLAFAVLYVAFELGRAYEARYLCALFSGCAP